jgi:peptidoglycan/xylan/chitin deacetylase (PgdA/CDA1 family)
VPLTRFPVLLYHKIGCPPRGCRLAGHYVSPGLFRKQLRFLCHRGFQTASLSSLAAALLEPGQEHSLQDDRPLFLTFDDGYQCLHELALPLLQEVGFGGVIFLVADHLGGAADWERAPGPRPGFSSDERLLSRGQVLELLGLGLEFGSHTRTHPRLTQLSERRLRDEVRGSRSRLEDLLGRPCLAFAYPYGDWDERVVAAVGEAGYHLAFTTRRAWACAADPPLLLPRINIRRYNYLPLFARKLRRAQGTALPRAGAGS